MRFSGIVIYFKMENEFNMDVKKEEEKEIQQWLQRIGLMQVDN